jgi:DNA-directed RNA polymerase subunit M/transcription elongation factor TFIIS
MPGAVEQCEKCGHEMRWGYSQMAIDFAAQKRRATEAEVIDDFFEFNPSIARKRPENCPKCGATQSGFKVLHRYP